MENESVLMWLHVGVVEKRMNQKAVCVATSCLSLTSYVTISSNVGSEQLAILASYNLLSHTRLSAGLSATTSDSNHQHARHSRPICNP